MNVRALLAAAFALLSPAALAQHAGHAGHAMPASQEATASEEKQPGFMAGGRTDAPGGTADPHAGHPPPAQATPVDHSQMGHAAPAQETPVDHSQMDHAMPVQDTPVDHSQMGHAAPAQETPVDHSQMDHAMPVQERPIDHSQMDHAMSGQDTSVDHSQMGHALPAQNTPVDHSQMDHAMPAQDTPVDHSQMDHSQHGTRATGEQRTPVPPITDADRAAASFTGGHAAHDDGTHTFILFDRLEVTDGDHGRGQAWEVLAWTGKDIDKLWLRSEGERVEGRTESASIELLYGRAISPWWDLVAGIRHDFQPGDAQDHAAIGVIGMAPYKFEVEATAYLSEAGELSARLEAEYDTLLTNRLILQWLAEAELHGDDDPARGTGSGLSTIEAGLRLRYEIRREFAPYVGLVRERAFGGTAALRRAHGDPVDDTLVVAGVRLWF